MTEQMRAEAKKVAEKAMSLSMNIAEQHATTYYRQQKPQHITLYEVQAIFRQAFAAKQAELDELDGYEEEE